MRIAVVGAGISGLGCAHALARDPSVHVTLYEAAPRLGGHTHTVDVDLDGVRFPVDTGFLVCNERTYPNLLRLFDELAVPLAASDMSFSVSVPLAGGRRLEWAGSNLDTVFAQRCNLVSPHFLAMLADLLRFNRHATRIAQDATETGAMSLGEFLDAHGYSRRLRDHYLLPMAAAIWSCPIAMMLDYPVANFIRFCHNHGLLQVTHRPRWLTVRGGARQYVQKIAAKLDDVRAGDPVFDVRRLATGKVFVKSAGGREAYDHVVLASHSNQSLKMLTDATADERAVLAAVSYQTNRAWLHTDQALMPRSGKVWSSWNYLSDGHASPSVSVTYLLNRLQPLPFTTPLFLSLNPQRAPAKEHVIAQIEYAHPVFNARAVAAQRRLPAVQGGRQIWFAGAWTGYGFHEDGLTSGLAVADALLAQRRVPQPLAA